MFSIVVNGAQTEEGAMPSLWSQLLSRWLEPSPTAGIEHLCERMRRDIGVADGEGCVVPAEPIQYRNLSDVRIFCSLSAYR
jgi:hypothetical protein